MGGGIFVEKKRLRQRAQKLRACKIWGPFFAEKKKRLRQRTQKLRACKNMGAFFAEKKAPAATYPQAQGL